MAWGPGTHSESILNPGDLLPGHQEQSAEDASDRDHSTTGQHLVQCHSSCSLYRWTLDHLYGQNEQMSASESHPLDGIYDLIIQLEKASCMST